MNNTLVHLIGWRATVLHDDVAAYDRWNWLKRHLSPGALRTFDAGCGNGAFTMYAAKIGNEALGASFDERANQRAGTRARLLKLPRVRFVTLDLRDLDAAAGDLGEFDQTLCCETIEHIRNDAKLLRDLAALLKPGGKLLLTTPYKHYRPLVGDKVSGSENGGHVRWGYTHEEMRRLFADAGLEVVAEEYITGFVCQQLINFQRTLTRFTGRAFSWSMTFPLRIFWVLDAPVTRLIGYPHLSIGVVGRKVGA